jgi:hypothetical protein
MEKKEQSAHNRARDLVFASPEIVEAGARSLAKEFRVKDCTIDVLLKAQDGALIVVEVNTFKPEYAAWQVRKYCEVIERIAFDIFDKQVTSRGYIVMPHEWKKEKDELISKLQELMESYKTIPEFAITNAINGFKSELFPSTVEESSFMVQVKYL